jgi:MSHA biogenesis protein MshP
MKKYHHGFVLVSAIFLLVVIAALGLFSVTISTTQQQSSAMDALGSRAYQAAKAGIESSIYQITKGGAACATFTPAMPTGTQLSAFAVSVTCSSTGSYTDGTATFSVYQLISTATTGTVGSSSYFERQLQVAITNP